jgi:hypothetical protein
MWYLIAVVWIALMVGIISTYTRKQRRRAREREQHLAGMLVELKASAKADAAAFAAAEATAADAKAAANPDFRRKQRLLPQPAALVYYIFRAGLPDHEIFAGMALNDVLELATEVQPLRREPLQCKLADQRLDFVVCNKQLEIVAAVVVCANTAAGPGDQQPFLNQSLQAAGVRLVQIDPASLPRHHQVHALIYG